jgi:hypothetical protein
VSRGFTIKIDVELRRVAHYRRQFARWGLRGFYLLFGVAAMAIAGYVVFPQFARFAGPIEVVLLVCAWICIPISCTYFVRYLVARRKAGGMIR